MTGVERVICEKLKRLGLCLINYDNNTIDKRLRGANFQFWMLHVQVFVCGDHVAILRSTRDSYRWVQVGMVYFSDPDLFVRLEELLKR